MNRIMIAVNMTTATLAAAAAQAATATFTPLGPTTVPPGTDVVFELTVTATQAAGFDAADIIIGCDEAIGIEFTYSDAWRAAFFFATALVYNSGFYTHDVFAGGNLPLADQTSLVVGTLTVRTGGMAEGTFAVMVDPMIDGNRSNLGLDGVPEPLSGSATYSVECLAADVECDGDVDLVNYAAFQACLTGPGVPHEVACDRFDTDANGRIDLADMSALMLQYTGAK